MDSIKEKIRDYFKESGTRPLSVNELEEKLEFGHSEDFKQLVISLNELEETGELVRTRKNRFGLPEKMNLIRGKIQMRSEEHTSELQSRGHLVCRLLLEKKKKI